MNDPILIAAISATAALIGALIGSLFSIAIAGLNRRWAREDERRAAKINIVENRCGQSETYATAIISDFYDMRHAFAFLIQTSDPEQAGERRRAYTVSRDSIDRLTYANGPAVESLGDEDLLDAFRKINSIWREQATAFFDFYMDKFVDHSKVDDDKVEDERNELTRNFTSSVALFYERLDAIRKNATS